MQRRPAEAQSNTSSAASAPSAAADTRRRILAAAEQLFAEKGLDKTTMRELTMLAGVNIAAANYHFRSKEALAEAVFEQIGERVNTRRLQELQACLDSARRSGSAPSVRAIIESFIRPYVDNASSQEGLLLARFILQHRMHPTPMTARILEKHFDPMAKRYIAAFARALPEIDPVEHFWRYNFMVSTVVLTVTDRGANNRLARLSGGQADPVHSADLHHYLVRYLEGSFGSS